MDEPRKIRVVTRLSADARLQFDSPLQALDSPVDVSSQTLREGQRIVDVVAPWLQLERLRLRTRCCPDRKDRLGPQILHEGSFH